MTALPCHMEFCQSSSPQWDGGERSLLVVNVSKDSTSLWTECLSPLVHKLKPLTTV